MVRRISTKSEHLAVLILESPWSLYKSDNNRSSVRPFFEGLAAKSDNIAVHHANFYDYASFEKAFTHLTKVKYTNAIVYIAAHGYGDEIEGAKISELLALVKARAKTLNISGVILGSCYVGGDEESLCEAIQGSGLLWCVGYRSSVDWFSGTMIDLALVHELLNMYQGSDNDEEHFSDLDKILSRFKLALSLFDQSFVIGDFYHKRKRASLFDSLTVVVQPRGAGKRAVPCSDRLWE